MVAVIPVISRMNPYSKYFTEYVGSGNIEDIKKDGKKLKKQQIPKK
ncbi:hypothetical protein [Leptotrichia sp. OH3620_COT-345]|nr:hypothetical protein [Leptotrichia sp. OH3620_COT-345]